MGFAARKHVPCQIRNASSYKLTPRLWREIATCGFMCPKKCDMADDTDKPVLLREFEVWEDCDEELIY